jgi:hypothetical protein
MKAKFKIILLLAVTLISCDKDLLYVQDNIPPSVPTNILTETGDELVIIEWSKVYSNDLAGYAVYYSDSYDGKYNLLGTTKNISFIDYGANNGITYYYAVASYDYDGNESDLSYDVAYDTPRPEGLNQSVYELWQYPNLSGYDFSSYKVSNYNSDNTDFFFEFDNGVFYLNVWADTDIQNMGRTNSIYEVSYAPIDGWVSIYPNDNVKYVEAIQGNTYIIWTHDNHFAKIRISNIYNDHVEFDWAYQTASGNVELKTNRGMSERKLPAEISVNRK